MRELLTGAGLEEGTIARRPSGATAYPSARLEEEPFEASACCFGPRAERRPATRQRAEVRFAALERVFGMGGETLATMSVGPATRIAEKLIACTHRLYINRLLGRTQGLIKASWA